MKKKMNQVDGKGYTLIELLGVIVIIGVLSTITIASISGVVKRSKKQYNLKQAKLFTSAAQTYFTDNKSRLPKDIFTTNSVDLETLEDQNYIKSMVDHTKKPYDKKNSRAIVKKLSAGNYRYTSLLVLDDKKKTKYRDGIQETETEIGENKEININYLQSESDSSNTTSQLIGTKTGYYINRSITIPFNISYSKKIVAYKYRLYRVDEQDKKYYESNYMAVDEQGKERIEDRITLSQKNLLDGIYELEVVALDKTGKFNKKRWNNQIVIDGTKPKCTINLSGEKGNTINDNGIIKHWYKKGGDDQVKLTMSIDEKNLYKSNLGKIKRDINEDNFFEQTKTFSEKQEDIQADNTDQSGQNWYGDIVDKAGNIGKCEVIVYFDKELPQCKISKNVETISSGWTRSDYTVTRTCEDSYSGCDDQSNEIWTQNYQAEEGTVNNGKIELPNNGIVEDKAGNQADCGEHTIKIDKQAPSCKTEIDGTKSKYNNDWYIERNVTIKGKCEDSNGSGCNGDTNEQTVSTDGTTSISLGDVSDQVGNRSTCDNVSINLEKEKPKITSSTTTLEGGNYCNDGWTNEKYNVKISFTLPVSGFKELQRKDETCPFKDENNNNYCTVNTTAGTLDIINGQYTSDDYTNETNRKVCYYIISEAGNVSNKNICSTITIDKTNPMISVTPINNKFSLNQCTDNVNNKKTCNVEYVPERGATLTATNDNGGSKLDAWGASAKYKNMREGKTCELNNYVLPWSEGEPVCNDGRPMGTGDATRCYKVRDCAGNESTTTCVCHISGGKVLSGKCRGM